MGDEVKADDEDNAEGADEARGQRNMEQNRELWESWGVWGFEVGGDMSRGGKDFISTPVSPISGRERINRFGFLTDVRQLGNILADEGSTY